MLTLSQGHTSRLWDSVEGDLAVLQTVVLFCPENDVCSLVFTSAAYIHMHFRHNVFMVA